MPPDKVKSIALGILKFLGFLVCFYFFICALELMTTSFKLLVGTEKIKDWLQDANDSYSYPARMMIGVVGTMIVQSSSAFTSVVVAAIATKVVDLKTAIPMIMGANFGTTITNTLVSMAHLRNRNELRLAIAASSIHDFCCVFVDTLFCRISAAYRWHLRYRSFFTARTPLPPWPSHASSTNHR